jgi:uncharacterized protein YegL
MKEEFSFEPLGEDMFRNPERRCPVILLLDTSGSMATAMNMVNLGIQDMKNQLMTDPLACQRVEVAIITFGPVVLAQDFVTVDQWVPPRLAASGNTPIGEALTFAINQLNLRKAAYREAGIPYYRPWIWLVTDGAPTDAWRPAALQAKAESAAGGIELFTVGTDYADFNVLREISEPRAPVRLREARYREMFVWLSQSLKPVSTSRPGSPLTLEPPSDWGKIES